MRIYRTKNEFNRQATWGCKSKKEQSGMLVKVHDECQISLSLSLSSLIFLISIWPVSVTL